jgi:AraC-like DNA-binding protein
VDYLQDLVRNADSYRPGDTTRLVTITLDLITTMLARELDHGRSLPPDSSRQALLAQIHAYIGKHLADPELSLEAIAAAHHVSVRSLHRLFQAQDTTVMAWIRARRLDHSRRDLADPQLRDRPIHAIAARWGFTAPHFTRIFHTTYGVRPQDFRIQQLSHPNPRASGDCLEDRGWAGVRQAGAKALAGWITVTDAEETTEQGPVAELNVQLAAELIEQAGSRECRWSGRTGC